MNYFITINPYLISDPSPIRQKFKSVPLRSARFKTDLASNIHDGFLIFVETDFQNSGEENAFVRRYVKVF